MFYFTIMIILLMFTLDIFLSTLNYKYRNHPIPENVSDVYDKKEYTTWLKYTMEVFRLSIITKIINTITLILFLLFDGFIFISNLSKNFTSNSIIHTILFLGIYSIISYLLTIAFSIYRTFNIEERYGFNKSTVKTFVMDQIKSFILTTILGGGLLYILLYIYKILGNKSLIYVWLVILSVSLIINILYTKVFIKIFNKLTPLPGGELYDKVKALVKTTEYGLSKISVIDASKRSSRLNAFFSGFGKFKHIILYDTLLEKCSSDEIVSVLAHEIGHSKHKDVLKNLLITAVQLALYLLILGLFLSSTSLFSTFGFTEVHVGFSLILFGILMEPISIIIGIPLTALSRKAEYKADAFAAKSGYKSAMISALKVLAKENFSNLTPHPLLVKLTYSHPPISDRIKALDKHY